MNISKPENEDLRVAGEFIGMMNLVAQGYNPLKQDEFDEFIMLEDEDKDKVLDALCEKFNNCDLDWLFYVLGVLLSPNAGVIDQDSDILVIHPRQIPADGNTEKSEG
ncbi:hypothetical protein [Neisseria sp. HMSC061B04]|uniref:hypothetical protein n=1 Tax=Neisseria sp. HMSC061B04 TaxID=1715140 RepID=UPI0008A86FDB|nr:hypothetical protein [Neisseria sp. HMSC061B04]OHP52421.1 hypothetical protein HMPREF2661_02290 [Neisseria sp. HMSC061B04]